MSDLLENTTKNLDVLLDKFNQLMKDVEIRNQLQEERYSILEVENAALKSANSALNDQNKGLVRICKREKKQNAALRAAGEGLQDELVKLDITIKMIGYPLKINYDVLKNWEKVSSREVAGE